MRRAPLAFGTAALALLGGCASRSVPARAAVPAAGRAAAVPRSSPQMSVAASYPVLLPPNRALTLAEARRYMVELINRDRASVGLAPVTLDEGAATRAGQAHADDMATHGYLGHFGTDGSVPEQRLTEAGGTDMVLENASCFTDERSRRLDAAPTIEAANIEQSEAMFFHEKPPNDGHRKNILTPWHTRVGIGVAQPVPTPVEIPVPCFAQEFVDSYGRYATVPNDLHVGDRLHVEGNVFSPAIFAGVGLARVEAPKPVAVAQLNRRRSYPVPPPYQTYWPPGFKTPIPVWVDPEGHFVVDLPVSDGGRPGMYELSIWAKVPGSESFVMVSLRTIQVR